LLHDALSALWEFVGDANKFVESEQPWSIAKAAKVGDAGAEARLAGVLGDLVEAARLVSLAVAPFMPSIAPRALAQLGHAYPYASDGNGGPPLLEALTWAGSTGQARRLGVPEPLFPRLETEAAAEAAVDSPSA
jgi:methionyl-tRNA synthetase